MKSDIDEFTVESRGIIEQNIFLGRAYSYEKITLAALRAKFLYSPVSTIGFIIS